MVRGARIANVVLGVWLFISAFAWLHTGAQQANTLIVGVLVAAMAAVAMRVDNLRYGNTAAATWLFISPWFLPTLNAATFWNNMLVAIAVFVFSLIPSQPAGPREVTRREPLPH